MTTAQLVFFWSVIFTMAGVILVLSTDASFTVRQRLARQLGIPCKHRGCTMHRWHESPHLHLVLIERRQTGSFRKVA
jgi:hypothetical protein